MAHGSSHVLCSSSNWRPDASGIFFLSARLAVGKPGKEKLFFGISPNVQGCPLVRLAAQDRMQRRLRAYAGKGSGIQDYTRKGSGLLTPLIPAQNFLRWRMQSFTMSQTSMKETFSSIKAWHTFLDGSSAGFEGEGTLANQQ